MYTVVEYFIGLDLQNCRAKFRGDTVSCSWENEILKLLFLVIFPDIPELELPLPPRLMDGRMWRWAEVRLAKLLFLYFL